MDSLYEFSFILRNNTYKVRSFKYYVFLICIKTDKTQKQFKNKFTYHPARLVW